MDYKILGKRIRKERQKLNLTQAKLAEIIEVSVAYIGQIERGERKFSIETLVKISEALNITIDTLLSNNCNRINKPLINEMAEILDRRSNEDIIMAIDVVKVLLDRIDKD